MRVDFDVMGQTKFKVYGLKRLNGGFVFLSFWWEYLSGFN